VRQWLDLSLKRVGLDPDTIAGYQVHLPSHQAVAHAIRAGRADAGIGIAASARPLGLDFIPLFEEPYELAMPVEAMTDQRLAPLFDYLNSGEFGTVVRRLDGYAVSQKSGTVEVVK
jgi:putative molybdopterin biosynthesis protein